MTLDEFRQEMEDFRDRVDLEASEMKDSYLALQRLASLYERFDDVERTLADKVLSEWTLSEDEGKRFDAMALIRKFRVVQAVPSLRQLGERLKSASEPGAPFEREKVDLLVRELSTEESAT